ncbi:AlpA family phage regulatory protein [Dyella sp. AtDHG13]|uniref:helix-turn-helix transcriptional regulator n=1 Tax=Dyella sp. AtDHG13 TaxID=1938897 RepID=UPI0009F687ED|nr:AlpA family phage regulatory protein [Dyella sp. AtDHG13]
MSECLLPRREVERRTGLSRSSIYARMKAGTFPLPVHDDDTHSVWWVASEIDAWVMARIAARNARNQV